MILQDIRGRRGPCILRGVVLLAKDGVRCEGVCAAKGVFWPKHLTRLLKAPREHQNIRIRIKKSFIAKYDFTHTSNLLR